MASSFVTNELLGPAVYFKFDIDPIRTVESWKPQCASSLRR